MSELPDDRMKRVENRLEHAIFASRWLLTPLYIGLIAAIALIMVKFVRELLHLVVAAFKDEGGNLIAGVLSLVDLVMIANLLVLIIFAGYENFVSKIDTGSNEDRPDWMGYVTFSDLKIKMIGSIVAISAIELLKVFMSIKSYSDSELAWKVGLHLLFAVSGVLFAIMDKLAGHKGHAASQQSRAGAGH
jgi:uncharacterized protein (TIGR00645 family)